MTEPTQSEELRESLTGRSVQSTIVGPDRIRAQQQQQQPGVSSWMAALERGIRCVTEFAKQLPVFRKLPTTDQIELVKRKPSSYAYELIVG
jgi:hypothetical protein